MTMVTLLLVDAVIYVFNGFVLKVLWGWFIAPKFQLPTLSLASAIGLGIVVGFLTSHSYPEEKELGDRISRIVAHNLIIPTFALLAGWVTHFFI